ncbi:MAG: proton-conducting transporter membrane subunit [Sulfolobales archaeon]
MDSLGSSLIPFICLMLAVLVPLTYIAFGKKVGSVVVLLGSITVLILALKLFVTVSRVGVIVYRFGGFPPPLGVVYVFDEVNSVLALSISFVFLLSVVYTLTFEDDRYENAVYSLFYLLMSGVYGCLFTGDIFNFYVSIELVAVSSYVLTGFNRGKRAVRAAIVYGIAGTAITSFLLLASFIIYGSYGTLNIADIALKSRNTSVEVLFSGSVFGDIVLPSKVTLALITWIFLFKSGIMPNHFWLPEAYSVAPLPALVLFSASADTLGIYGLIRLYHLVFSSESVIRDFRATMLGILLLLGTASAIMSSMLVAKQKSIRKLIAYSSISQFSLALLGIVSGTEEGLAGSILHLVVNGLGDAAVLYSVGILKYYSANLPQGYKHKPSVLLAKAVLIVGLINLFGVIPIIPGFWSKALLVLGFVKSGIAIAAVAVLVSAGLCAIGYFSALVRVLQKYKNGSTISSTGTKCLTNVVAVIILSLTLIACVGLGISITLYSSVRAKVIELGYNAMNSWRYIAAVLP